MTLSELLDFHVRAPALPFSAAVSVYVPGGSAVHGPPISPPSPPLAPCFLVTWAAGFSPLPAPFRPPLVIPQSLWSRPMAALSSRLVSGCGRGFPGVVPSSPCTPLYRSCATFLCDPWQRRQRFSSLLRPPCDHPVLLHLLYRQIFCTPAAPSLACVTNLLIAVPLAALSPVSVAAYLVLGLSPALCLRRRLPLCGCRPPFHLHLSTWPSCRVPVLTSLSGASPPFLPWALAATCL